MKRQRKGVWVFACLSTVAVIASLHFVRSRVFAEQQLAKRAVVEYSAVRKIYNSTHRYPTL
jgi:hypothetical protein